MPTFAFRKVLHLQDYKQCTLVAWGYRRQKESAPETHFPTQNGLLLGLCDLCLPWSAKDFSTRVSFLFVLTFLCFTNVNGRSVCQLGMGENTSGQS